MAAAETMETERVCKIHGFLYELKNSGRCGTKQTLGSKYCKTHIKLTCMVFNKNIFKAGLLQRTHTYKQYKTAGPLPPGSCPSYFNNFQVLSHVFIAKQIVKAFFRYGVSTSYIILPFSHRYLALAYLKDLKRYHVGPPNVINSFTNFMKTIVFS